MDFNPLMLLAGNLTSIIQGSGEEGLRKMRKREREREVRKKGERSGRRGEGQRHKCICGVFPMCPFPLLQFLQAPLLSVKHHPP